VANSHCAASIWHEQDVKMTERWLTLEMDCAAICALAVAAIARDSEHAKAIGDWCATICKSCGDECGKHRMEQCQKCAKACHRCADECRKMAATPATLAMA